MKVQEPATTISHSAHLPFFHSVTFILSFVLCSGVLKASTGETVTSPSAAYNPLRLWYNTPAHSAMNEALPVGNASIGALVYGDPFDEKLVLNQASLWTGGDNPSGDYATMGAYQALSTLHLKLGEQQTATSYVRDLDIHQAVALVRYSVGGVTYTREIFASRPAGVIIMRLTADHPGSYTGTLALEDAHHAKTTSDGNTVEAVGELDNHLKYQTSVRMLHDDGSVQTSSGEIQFSKCTSLTLLIAAGTDYAEDGTKGFRGSNPRRRIADQLGAAGSKDFRVLRAEHIADYQKLFDRVTFNVGSSSAEQRALPTNLRKREAAIHSDPEMAGLLFQYGRYLLISSSRPGGLPANLQGIWNDKNNPEWHSDYHSNINVEMNYWPVEVANLAECAVPFFDLVESQLPSWRIFTQDAPDLLTPSGKKSPRGFAIRTSHNIMGGMGWRWDLTANAWYAQLFWEHYAFGQNRQYLQNIAYPALKETTEFWEDHLKQLPDGRLVVPDGWSPEHGPVKVDGVSYAQEIVWNLFNNFIQAADILDVDTVYRSRIASLRDRLARPGIGSWGQLLEWHTELHDPILDTPNDHHRHTSHLFALYPGREISVQTTPELAAAARTSLIARGNTGDVREWSFAWRTALWARLKDGEMAYDQIQQLFQDRNTTPNLFGNHPPVQLDGNFGITAGIAEMLLQSQTEVIEFLPALPREWQNGSITGLRARGNYTVDMKWTNGQLSFARISGKKGAHLHLRYGAKTTNAIIPASGRLVVGADLQTHPQHALAKPSARLRFFEDMAQP